MPDATAPPPVPRTQQGRLFTFHIRLSDEQRAALAQAATARGLSLGRYVVALVQADADAQAEFQRLDAIEMKRGKGMQSNG